MYPTTLPQLPSCPIEEENNFTLRGMRVTQEHGKGPDLNSVIMLSGNTTTPGVSLKECHSQHGTTAGRMGVLCTEGRLCASSMWKL